MTSPLAVFKSAFALNGSHATRISMGSSEVSFWDWLLEQLPVHSAPDPSESMGKMGRTEVVSDFNILVCCRISKLIAVPIRI
jgi:hypothetical protein